LIEVLHICPAVFGKDGVVGGAERYALELARHMAEKVSTTLVAFGPERRTKTDGKLTIEEVPADWLVRGQSQNPFSLKLFPFVREARVVHCHQKHILTTSLVAGLRKLFRRPVFVTDLGGGGWDLSAFLSTDSWFTGELHISRYSSSLSSRPHPNSRVILGGVDTDKFSPGPEPKEKRIVFVGRLLPHKGVDYLIESLPPGLELEVIGEPYDSRYYETLQDLARGKLVRFTRGASDDYLVSAYRRSLAVVLPSLYRDRFGAQTKVPELLGQTLLEGMACGTAAIATDVASLPEIVERGVSGYLVAPGDSASFRRTLEGFAGSPDVAEKMGRNARERVLEHFTWKQVVERCLDAYDSRSRV
jgi:glycosyltransferase involved in cell wall biosynthesis